MFLHWRVECSQCFDISRWWEPSQGDFSLGQVCHIPWIWGKRSATNGSKQVVFFLCATVTHPFSWVLSVLTCHDKPICTWFSLISWHCTTILFLKTYEFLDFPRPGYQIKGSTHLWPSSHCKSRCQVGVVEVFGGNQLHNSLQTTTSHQHLQAALRRVAEVWDESSHLAGGYIVGICTAKVMAVSWGTCGKMVGHQ